MRGKINLYLALLIFIIAFGFCLRVYRLSEIPSGFFADEASIGYNAYTILTKGVDEHDNQYPLFFKAFGEYKSPVQIYSTVPSIALLGLNEFSVRLTSVIYGILSIFVIYLLTKELFKNYRHKEWIGIFSSLFLAISPWHTHFSRIAFEMMPFVFFTTLATYIFLKSQTKPQLLPLSTAIFTIALYSYYPARIFIPLFGLGIFFIYLKCFLNRKKVVFASLILLIILLGPLIRHMQSPSGFSRWNQVNIFSKPPKDESITKRIVDNYLSHFSLDFLFLKGDIDMPGQFITRHSAREMGELYLFQLPLIIVGFCSLFLKREKRMLTLLILWFILYPTGSMFTADKSAQATRSIIGVIPFQVLSAVGLYYLLILFSKFKKSVNYLSILSIFIIFASFLHYLNLYFAKYPLYSSDYLGWQYGYQEVINYFSKNQKKFDELLITHRYNGCCRTYQFYG